VSGETYPSKEQLKNHGFRWDPSSKTWHKAVRAEGFQFDEVLGEPWVAEGVKVRVCSGRGEILHER
jgi:hypothetical protein